MIINIITNMECYLDTRALSVICIYYHFISAKHRPSPASFHLLVSTWCFITPRKALRTRDRTCRNRTHASLPIHPWFPVRPACPAAQGSWERRLDGTEPQGSPVQRQSRATHVITGPQPGGAVVCVRHRWQVFVLKFPPAPPGGKSRLPLRGPATGDGTEWLSWKPRLPLGPKGHFWKWFGI